MIISAIDVTSVYNIFMEDIEEYEKSNEKLFLDEKEYLLEDLLAPLIMTNVYEDKSSMVESIAITGSRNHSENGDEYGPIYDFIYGHMYERGHLYQKLNKELVVTDNYRDIEMDLVIRNGKAILEVDAEGYTYNLPIIFDVDTENIVKTIEISQEVNLFITRYKHWCDLYPETGIGIINYSQVVTIFMGLIELFLQTSDVNEYTVDSWVDEYKHLITKPLLVDYKTDASEYMLRFIKHDSEYLLALFNRLIKECSTELIMHSWGHFGNKTFLALTDKQ